MDDVGRRLFDSLSEGFGPYVDRHARSRGLDEEAIARIVEDGRRLLDGDLQSLLGTPVEHQTTTPLEVFRDSLQPLTTALEQAGVEPPQRDTQQAIVAPGDPFDIWPASAAQVSEAAWEAAIAWGAAKASQVVLPLLVVMTRNLMDVGPFEAAAARSGYRFEHRRPGETDGSHPSVAFVDLDLPSADAIIESMAAGGTRVVAYGPHVDSFAMTRARSLGASAAEPRSRVLRDPSVFVSPVV